MVEKQLTLADETAARCAAELTKTLTNWAGRSRFTPAWRHPDGLARCAEALPVTLAGPSLAAKLALLTAPGYTEHWQLPLWVEYQRQGKRGITTPAALFYRYWHEAPGGWEPGKWIFHNLFTNPAVALREASVGKHGYNTLLLRAAPGLDTAPIW